MIKSKVLASSLTTPLLFAASFTSCWWGLSLAARTIAGRASKRKSGKSMRAKSKSTWPGTQARNSDGFDGTDAVAVRLASCHRFLPSCPMPSSCVCSFPLPFSPFMLPFAISCYILTTSESRTISLVDFWNSLSTSFGTSGVSYGEHRCSLQTPLNPF